MLDKITTIEALVAHINAVDSSKDITFKTSEYREKCRSLTTDGKEQGKVLNAVLEKMSEHYKNSSYLKETATAMLKHTAWTWFG